MEDLTWSEFQHVSSSWSNRCFFPNCRVLRFSTELTLETSESGRGERLNPTLRAQPPPSTPSSLAPQTPSSVHRELNHHCPPHLPGPSPAHCVCTNQRVSHFNSTRPQGAELGSARVRIPAPTHSQKGDLVHASEFERPHPRHWSRTVTAPPPIPVLNVALITPLPQKLGVSGTLPMIRGQESCGFWGRSLRLRASLSLGTENQKLDAELHGRRAEAMRLGPRHRRRFRAGFDVSLASQRPPLKGPASSELRRRTPKSNCLWTECGKLSLGVRRYRALVLETDILFFF